MVGIDVGGTKILGVRLDDRSVTAEVKRPTPAAGAEVVAALGEVVAGLAPEGPAAVGVGVPGLVDPDGRVRFSPHCPGLVGVGLAAELRAGWPEATVWTGNDASAAGWAEHRLGAGRGIDDLLMVTLGTGIGGGIVSGGVLREGAHRFAGEFGHMVVDPHGPPCPCGKRGCWERYASGTRLGHQAREAAFAGRGRRLVALAGGDPEAVRGEHVVVAAAEGDTEARAVLAGFAWWLALGIANLVNALDPSLVVVGGGLVDAGEVLLEPARAAFGDLVEAASERRPLAIVPASLGSRAGAVGAALLAAAAEGRCH